MAESESGENLETETSKNEERQICANGNSIKLADVEAHLDNGNVEAAESSIRDGLSLGAEEAKALLGKVVYRRGNFESALRVFEGIDMQSSIQQLQSSVAESQSRKGGRVRSESQPGASVVLEAILLKSKALHKLGRVNDAANECKTLLDAVETIFGQGLPDAQADRRLNDVVSQAAALLPELWKQAGLYQEALAAYRQALLSQWNISGESCARIQKGLAVFLLHSGVETSPPGLSSPVEGSFAPKNSLEEAILLLLILIRNMCSGKIEWDASVMMHLSFSLSLCSQTAALAELFEATKPGIHHRVDRWNNLALCYIAIGKKESALSLLRKSLHRHERPDDLIALLMAAKICSEDSCLAAEGIEYARRAMTKAQGDDEHLSGVASRMLGLCLGKQAKHSSSDFERARIQAEALKALDGAFSFEQNNPDLLFDLAIQYAEQRNLNKAFRCAKQFIDATGGSVLKGWRLLALILSAQQRFSEAEVITDAALDETAKWDQGPLLRLKAKLKISQSLHMDAIETYRHLLALAQAQRKSSGTLVESAKVNEFEVWHGLADLYSRLSHWKDVEVCLGKAKELKQYSAEVLHIEGVMCQGRGQIDEAIYAYVNALLLEWSYVPCKVLVSSLISKLGGSALPVARTILSDALRIDPTNRTAWYYLGVIHKDDGRIADAADCFQAASMLEESDPVELFSSVR